MSTAAIVIIGNEILSGKYVDQNTPFLVAQLRDLGVRVLRVAVVPDELEAMAGEIARCSALADHVFTTGGVGPTHDDVTMWGVAAAFEEATVEHPALLKLLRGKVDGALNPAMRRMAMVPESAELIFDGGVRFPLVKVHNVFIFPGVPSLVKLKFEAVAERFRTTPFHLARVRTSQRETEIADLLREALEAFDVDIGSYPRFDESPRHVVVTVEGKDGDHVEACRAWLADRLDPLP